jgi:DNA replication protein DnaC
MNSHVRAPTTVPWCLVCRLPIPSVPVVKRWRGKRVELHGECWEPIANQPLERRAFAEGRLVRILSSLPRFTFAAGSPEFSECVPSKQLQAVAQRYNPLEHGSLSLLGPAGCGKSVTACAVTARLCAEAVEAYVGRERDSAKLDWAVRIFWTTAAELCSARRQHRLGEGEAPAFKRAETAPLLVLDEVGQEIADDRWLLELLDVRYAGGLPTLSTSGFTRTQLEARYGSGTLRRLVEPSGRFIDLFAAPKGGAPE